jgi:hypothetical protein
MFLVRMNTDAEDNDRNDFENNERRHDAEEIVPGILAYLQPKSSGRVRAQGGAGNGLFHMNRPDDVVLYQTYYVVSTLIRTYERFLRYGLPIGSWDVSRVINFT